jgi:hypothetical protein
MLVKTREEWIEDPTFKKWARIDCTEKHTICKCDDGNHLVELWEHDSCVRGRIDTVVCTTCDSIKTFKIVR